MRNLIFFFFPPCCEVCGCLLVEGEKLICSYCLADMPRTFFTSHEDNPVARIFWGRIRVIYATAYMHFFKGSRYQSLLHQLKYHGRDDIGLYLGQLFGAGLSATVFAKATLITPVPLHPKKQKKRGYNQSEKIAQGMGQALGIPISSGLLYRKEFTGTQTAKGRYERFVNMQDKFGIRPGTMIENKTILLVDDVVTTGATLEACASVLIDAGASVMIAVLAVA